MEIIARREGKVTVITLSGHLDVTTTAQTTEAFNQHLRDGQTQLVVDLSQLTYISSAGLRVLLAAAKEARRQNGDLRLAAIQTEEVTKVMRMSGFSNILKNFPDLPAAIASFTA